MIENATIVFHFNKAHLTDPTIPMWVLKIKGETHYVSHVTVEPGVGFCTKETPDNPHTKGAIKIKGTVTFVTTPQQTTEAVISPC